MLEPLVLFFVNRELFQFLVLLVCVFFFLSNIRMSIIAYQWMIWYLSVQQREEKRKKDRNEEIKVKKNQKSNQEMIENEQQQQQQQLI